MKNSNYKEILVYEDCNYIAINKPPFVPTISERIKNNIDLLSIMRKHYRDAKVCHRLDKGTSGIVIFAKNKEAQRYLSIQFSRREVFKEYHAIVNGQHNFEEEIARGPIMVKSNQVKIDFKNGKKARTLFTTTKIYDGYSLIRCRPITGRTHQIRIHAFSKKASLIGDLKYNGKNIFLSDIKRNYKSKKNKEELPIIKRIALHAFRVNFTNLEGQKIFLEAPYPKDFKTTIKYLEKYANIVDKKA